MGAVMYKINIMWSIQYDFKIMIETEVIEGGMYYQQSSTKQTLILSTVVDKT